MKWLAIVLVIGSAIFTAAPAFCSFCYPMDCYSTSACGPDCVCLRSGAGRGRCTGIR